MNRRTILHKLASLPLVLIGARAARAATNTANATKADIAAIQSNWKTLLASNAEVAPSRDPLNLPNDEWKKKLSPMAYSVLREEDTERPGSSPLNAEKRPGVFACAGCSLPLFTSAMKYES